MPVYSREFLKKMKPFVLCAIGEGTVNVKFWKGVERYPLPVVWNGNRWQSNGRAVRLRQAVRARGRGSGDSAGKGFRLKRMSQLRESCYPLDT
jgi:hypothetical protein